MWNDLRIKIIYRLKIMEFRIQAWIKALEVSRAYSHKKLTVRPKQVIHFFRVLFLYMGILFIGIGALYGIVRLLQMRAVGNPEAAIVRNEPEQSRPEIPSADSILNVLPIFTEMPAEKSQTGIDSQIVNQASVAEKFEVPEKNYFIIFANKGTKKFSVLQNTNGNWKVIRTYPMGIGAQPGRKRVSGDKRTPEGYYFIVDRKEKRELSSIYGPLAFVLNYPNQEDRKEGRTGQGIWIHGTEPDSLPGETRGCLEIANENILELGTILKDGFGTPVVIVNEFGIEDPIAALNFELIENERNIVLSQHNHFDKEFKTLLQNWELAWESKNIDQYKNFYDTLNFNSQGERWKSWELRKVRTFEIYSRIDITINNVQVYDNSDKSVTVKFLQIYKSDKNSLENGKELRFVKQNDSWKITRETTIPKEELLL